MGEFLVERYLPGITVDVVRAAAMRLHEVIREMTSEGTEVRHLHCTFVPDEESVLCVFLGSSSDIVIEANRRADFGFDRVVPATDIGGEAGRIQDGSHQSSSVTR